MRTMFGVSFPSPARFMHEIAPSEKLLFCEAVKKALMPWSFSHISTPDFRPVRLLLETAS